MYGPASYPLLSAKRRTELTSGRRYRDRQLEREIIGVTRLKQSMIANFDKLMRIEMSDRYTRVSTCT